MVGILCWTLLFGVVLYTVLLVLNKVWIMMGSEGTAEEHTIRLNNSQRLPLLTLGTHAPQLDEAEVEAAIRTAIEAGCRHFDAAQMYDNEKAVGKALRKLYKEGIIKREDVYITTKLWCTSMDPSDVMSACLKSLQRLQMDYVDAYLIHIPTAFVKGDDHWPKDESGKLILNQDVHYVQTWKVMEKIYREGLARSIGVSNFNEYQIKKIIDTCSIVPAINQVECHPYFAQEAMLKFCRENEIAMTAYAALGSPNRPWAAGEPTLLEDPVVNAIAQKHGKTPAQILTRFLIQRKISFVMKSKSPDRIKSNFQVFDFELTEDDMNELLALNKNERCYGMQITEEHKYFPFRENYSEDGDDCDGIEQE